MDELTIGDKVYISSKRAAAVTGYAKDYIGQLCREGRVEATLVGRSWYVLESSIRAHRFGPEVSSAAKYAQEEDPSANSTWEAPNYMAEEVQTLPSVERKGVNLLDADKPSIPERIELPTASPETVEDMQSAWREWFATRENARQEEDPSIEESEEIDEAVDEDYEDVSSQEEEIEIRRIETEELEDEQMDDPVPLTPEMEEEVPIQRNYRAEVAELHHSDASVRTQVAQDPVAPVASAIRWSEPRTRRSKKGRGSVASTVALICLSIFAIAIALIGTGAADAYISEPGIEYSMIRFLAGASILD